MNIEELKRLAEAATPGLWFAAISSNMNNSVHVSMGTICDTGKNIDDAAFIAAANPAAILELIRQRDELLVALKDAWFTLDKLRTASNGEQRRYAVSFAGNTIHVAPILEAIKDAIAKAEG